MGWIIVRQEPIRNKCINNRFAGRGNTFWVEQAALTCDVYLLDQQRIGRNGYPFLENSLVGVSKGLHSFQPCVLQAGGLGVVDAEHGVERDQLRPGEANGQYPGCRFQANPVFPPIHIGGLDFFEALDGLARLYISRGGQGRCWLALELPCNPLQKFGITGECSPVV
ncbi:hypothetical protein D3C81_755360 [compost metagenome]